MHSKKAITSAKRIKEAAARRARNLPVKSRSRAAVRRVVSISESEGATERAAQALSAAYTALDRAVSKKVLHKNTAARKKSRLARRLAALQAGGKSETAPSA